MTTPSPDKLEIPEAPYVPQLIYYSERDEFEFVNEDSSVVESALVPDDSVGILSRMREPREPVGFRIAGDLVRAAIPHMPDRGYAEVDWRCAKCGCHSFARIDRLSDGGKVAFEPGDYVRCVNCKDESYFPLSPAPADNGKITEDELWLLASAAENLRGGGHERTEDEQVAIRYRIAGEIDTLRKRLAPALSVALATPSPIEDVAEPSETLPIKLAKLRFFRDMIDAERAKVFAAFFGPQIAAEATTLGYQSMLFDRMFAARRVRPSPVDPKPILYLTESGETLTVEYDGASVRSLFNKMAAPPVGKKLLSLYAAPIDEDARDGVAARDVLAERERQKAVEGWTTEHDDRHVDGEMAAAAATYAYFNTAAYGDQPPAEKLWPESWEMAWWKPSGARRDLVKAGALIIAEIERLDRTSLQSQRKG